MTPQNGHASSHVAPSSIEHQFDALKEDLQRLAFQFDSTSQGYLGRARARIKSSPLIAVGIAAGVGYVVIGLARTLFRGRRR